MRLRIRDHKGLHGPLRLPKHNVKLGRGGIREIEFFTQTRQLIAGGRDTSLRVRGTVEGLARLAASEWIPDAAAADLDALVGRFPEVARALTTLYRQYRTASERTAVLAERLSDGEEVWGPDALRLPSEDVTEFIQVSRNHFPKLEAAAETLWDEAERGEVDDLEPLELARELRELLAHTDLRGTIFRSNHASNYLTLKGTLPKDRDALVEVLDSVLANPERAAFVPDWLRGL